MRNKIYKEKIIFHILLLIGMSIVLIFINTSCNNDNFEIENYKSKIVIDGWIEQDKYCKVLLTLSAPYFSDVDSASLRDYALSTAKVTLYNGTKEEVLTLKPNSNYFPPYVYISTDIKGEIGKTYTLTVKSRGIIATSTTTIPPKVQLDSAWFSLEKDSLGLVWIKFSDDILSKNYYRTLSKVKNKDSIYLKK